MAEDACHVEGVRQKCEDAHLGATVGAAEWEDLVDPGEQPRPAGAGGAAVGSRGGIIAGALSPRPPCGDVSGSAAVARAVTHSADRRSTRGPRGSGAGERVGEESGGPAGREARTASLEGDRAREQCLQVSERWLDLVQPEWTTFGVSSANDFEHVHDQAKRLLGAAGPHGSELTRTVESFSPRPAHRARPTAFSTGLLGESVDDRADRAAAAVTCG